jgi:hypothetical protein
MSIRTKPSYDRGFPPARLFLEDIEEIVRGLLGIVKNTTAVEGEDAVARVECTVGDHQCDDVTDLPKIARFSRDVEIEVRRGNSKVSLTLDAWSGSSYMYSVGLEMDRERLVHERILAIFRKRRLLWRGLAHSLPWWWSIPAMAVALMVALPLMRLPKTPWTGSAVALLLVLLLFGLYASSRHTSVVFRRSWEPSPTVVYLRDKIVPIVLGAALGVGGTLLEQFIKRKFWP